MSLWLKQSTAVVVSFGPALDKTDGVTEETGLVSALDHASTGIKLSKNGGALTIRHATVTATTYDAYGMYRVTLDTTDTNTLGTLRMAFNEAATCLPVWQDFMVLPANVYDSLVGGTDALDVSAIQFAGQTITAAAGVTIPSSIASPTNITAATGVTLTATTGLGNQTANITGTVSTVTTVTNQLTAAAIATGVWQDATAGDFTTASSIGKALYVANVAPGGAGGHFIAGTNAATAITTALTANITGNLSGSVGSVTGAVGSVTGAVGSVTGAVGSVTGAVGSVTGNVGGNVTGSVGSVAANGITSTSIATDAINAASVKADAVTKIQAGLATPTNITAGTITTVTNLTNAPTNGDLTATMKASVTAAVPTAAAITDAVWDENVAAHDLADTFGEAVSVVILGGTTAAAIRSAVGLATANLDTQLTAIDDYLDTEVAAIKAKTDLIPAAPAAVGDIPTAAAIADANWDEVLSGHLTAGTTGKALSDAGAAGTPLDAAGVRAAIGLAAADLDTQLAALPTAGENAAANWDEARAGHVAAGSFGDGVNVYLVGDQAIVAGSIDYHAIPPDAFDNTMWPKLRNTVWQALSADFAPGGTENVGGSIGEQMTRLDVDVSSAGGLDAAGVRAAVGLASANLDTQIATLATPTNITAGVITTVTNLTNAPTNGDLTATMKTSVTTAATAATPTAAAVTGAVGSVTGAVGSVTGNIGGNVGGNVTGTVGSVVGAVGSVTGNVGGNVVGSVASVTGAVGSLTTNNDKTGYALTSAERNAVSDALLDRADAISTGITTRQGIQVILDVLAAKLSGAATATITVRDVADTKNVLVYTTDSSGNRTAVTITP